MTQAYTGYPFAKTPPTQPDSEVEQGPFLGALLLALRERRLIVVCAIILPLLVVPLALRGPRNYVSSATIIPEGRKPASLASGLAAQFGVSVETDASDSPAFYADLISSREILSNVLDSTRVAVAPNQTVSLLNYYVPNLRDTIRRRDVALDSLRRVIGGNVTRKTGVVVLTASARSPQLAQSLANHVIDELSRFNLQRRQSKASAERRFTGGRLDEIRGELRDAEDRLQAFLQRNRGGNSPDLDFQKDRLTRDVQLRQQLYNTVSQAYEQARIDEVRDTPVLTILERPNYPSKPVSRQIAQKGVLAILSGFLIGFMIAVLRDRFSSLERRDRNSQQQLAELWDETKADVSRLWLRSAPRKAAS